MRLQVQSLASISGLRIRHCHELWCSSQTWLRSGAAVALAQAGGYSTDWTPSLGTSTCRGCGPKKKKKKRETDNRRWLSVTWPGGQMVKGSSLNLLRDPQLMSCPSQQLCRDQTPLHLLPTRHTESHQVREDGGLEMQSRGTKGHHPLPRRPRETILFKLFQKGSMVLSATC